MTSIADMPAGPELDALVAAVLGDDVPQFRQYSKWSETAMDALEKWREQHPEWDWGIDSPNKKCPDYRCWLDCNEHQIIAIGDTLALAISRAIAMAGEVQG